MDRKQYISFMKNSCVLFFCCLFFADIQAVSMEESIVDALSITQDTGNQEQVGDAPVTQEHQAAPATPMSTCAQLWWPENIFDDCIIL